MAQLLGKLLQLEQNVAPRPELARRLKKRVKKEAKEKHEQRHKELVVLLHQLQLELNEVVELELPLQQQLKKAERNSD